MPVCTHICVPIPLEGGTAGGEYLINYMGDAPPKTTPCSLCLTPFTAIESQNE